MGRLVIQPGQWRRSLRLIRPSLLLHRRSICLPRLALLLINAEHLLFSPTSLRPSLPFSLVTPLSHLALSRGSSLNYLNYILILLLGSPNVSHPAISGTFSLYRTTEIHSLPLLIPAAGAAASALYADIGKDIRVEIVTTCVEGCSAHLRKEGTEMRVT